VDIHQQGTMVKNFTRKKKDSNYGKAVTTSDLLLESIPVAKVNPDGDTRDRRTIEEIQQVQPSSLFIPSHLPLPLFLFITVWIMTWYDMTWCDVTW
jgi:hypothetical protein